MGISSEEDFDPNIISKLARLQLYKNVIVIITLILHHQGQLYHFDSQNYS